jgi:hypothetical protein
MAQLTLGYLLNEDPDRCLRFYCRACGRWEDKPLGAMVVALGEARSLAGIKGRCKTCGALVPAEVWKDTWSGPR